MFKKFKKAIKILEEELVIFLSKTIKFLELRLHFLYIKVFFLKNRKKIISELKNFCSDDPSDIFNFISQKYFSIFRPMQIKEEFIQLLEILKDKIPKTICEIGTANGGMIFSFSKLASDDATIISIDLPKGKFGGGYPKSRIPFYQAFAKKNQKLYLLREDSHQQKTLEKVENILNGKEIDFLFIDGDHTYEGCKKDFEMYSLLVRKGGIIAFHDITRHPAESQCFVHNFLD